MMKSPYYLSILVFVCLLSISCTKNIYEYYGVDPATEDSNGKDKTDGHNSETEQINKVQTVSSFIANDFGSATVWVEGFIVGSCTNNIKNAVWEYPFSSENAILMADEPGETDTDKVIAIQLRTKELKENFGLETNPDNYNKRIRFLGLKRKYLGIWGIKSPIQDYEWVE